MIGKIIENKYGLLIIGLIILGIGLFMASQKEITCGSSEMKPGTTCTTVRKGSSVTRTYAEERNHQQLTNYIFAGVGGLMTIGGAVWIIRSFTRKPGQ